MGYLYIVISFSLGMNGTGCPWATLLNSYTVHVTLLLNSMQYFLNNLSLWGHDLNKMC